MKTNEQLIAQLIAANDELAQRGLSSLAIIRAHIAQIRRRDPVTGRVISGLQNAAPLDFLSGAPVAQNGCATAQSAPRGKPSGAKRATAALPVAQQQQAGFPQAGRITGSNITFGEMK